MKLAGVQLPPLLADAMRQCRPHFRAAALFSLLINILFLSPALYMLQVYDRVVPTGGIATLIFITIALAIALLSLSALDSIRLRLMVRASLRLESALAPRLLRQMMDAPATAGQAMREFETIRTTIASPAAAALFDIPWVPVFVAVAFLLHFWLGILAVFATLAVLALAWQNQRATRRSTELASRAMASSHAWAQSAVVHGDTLRALGMQRSTVERQFEQRSRAVATMASAQFASSGYTAASRFLRLFVQSAALGLGAWLAIKGEISVGAIIAASIIVGRALQPVDTVIGAWGNLSAARAAAIRLSEATAEVPLEVPERTRLPDPRGNMELVQVGARAPDGRPILFGVSLTLAPGEVLGVVGPSGSGKTTLARIIAGAIPPSVGTVRMDGAELSAWDPDELGRHVGYMPQQPSLFEATVKDNISRFAATDPSRAGGDVDAAVVAAARLAGVHELILKLPNGYDTMLGSMGAGLSAGQAQRIALARALFGNPALLVLDEPNAFLDAEGEAALAEAVKATRARGAAVLIAAHRQSILDFADRILVLDAGRARALGDAKQILGRLSGRVTAGKAGTAA